MADEHVRHSKQQQDRRRWLGYCGRRGCPNQRCVVSVAGLPIRKVRRAKRVWRFSPLPSKEITAIDTAVQIEVACQRGYEGRLQNDAFKCEAVTAAVFDVECAAGWEKQRGT